MRDPVMDKEGNVRVGYQVEGFLGGWIGGHYYGGRARVGRAG